MRCLFAALGCLAFTISFSSSGAAVDRYSRPVFTPVQTIAPVSRTKTHDPFCCLSQNVLITRSLNNMSEKLVRRKTEGRDLVYFIDPSRSLQAITADLTQSIGNVLEYSSYMHKHNIQQILTSYKESNGWPLANVISIRNHRIKNVCIVSPLSHKRSGMEFASKMMGTNNLPVVHNINEFAVRFLSIAHESLHCITTSNETDRRWNKTFLETVADVGAVNEALKLGIRKEHLIALADWRALRFATGIVNVIAGRESGKSIYSSAAPSHMSTVAITRLLKIGVLDTYEEIEALAYSSTVEGLYGDRNKAQVFLTKIFKLYKNKDLKAKFPNASLQDADEILNEIGAPKEVIAAVKQSVQRYLAKLSCKNIQNAAKDDRNTKIACRQSDSSYIILDKSVFGSSFFEDVKLKNASIYEIPDFSKGSTPRIQ